MNKFFILLLFLPLKATAMEDGQNLREMCREDVADKHLDLNNRVTLDETTIEHSKTKLELAKLESRSIQEQLKILYKKQKVENFNYSLEQKISGKEYQLDQSRELEKSYKMMLSKSSKGVVESKRNLAAFEKTIEPVFYKMQVEKESEGYKFKLEYRRSCPKHNIVCALSSSDKKSFSKILPYLADKADCKRYMNIENYEP